MELSVNPDLLEALVSALPTEVHILEPIRDERGEISDFRYLAGSHTAYGKSGELSGKQLLSIYPWKKEAGIFDRFRDVADTGNPLDMVFLHESDGHHRWYHIKARRFGKGIVVLREDITTARQAEEKIMQLNWALYKKNRHLEALSSELKTFNSIAAHEYNDTLRNLYKNLEFIIKNEARELSDAGKANIRRAQASIQKLKLMTEDIIAFSNVHSEQEMVTADLNEVVSMALHALEDRIRGESAVVNVNSLPSIEGYPPLLALLFQHLISNSLEFRRPESNPDIRITADAVKGTDLSNEAAIPGAMYQRISVRDNGIGFQPEEADKIFTMFYRTQEKGRHKGSGVGLAICKKIMDLHGGFISAECQPACTTFYCYFPVVGRN